MILSPLAYISTCTELDSLADVACVLLSKLPSCCVTCGVGRAQKSDALIWQKESFSYSLPPSIQKSKQPSSPRETSVEKSEVLSNMDCLPGTKHYLPLHIKQLLLVGINWCNDLKTRAASICGETLTVVANPAFGSAHKKAK